MIITGFNNATINESVTGELAKVLKGSSKSGIDSDKRDLIYTLKNKGIDFNRSIQQAELVHHTDPRLKEEGNIIIGIYQSYYNDGSKMTSDGKYLNMAAYETGVGPITSNKKNIEVYDKSGKVVRIKDLADLSWKKWLEIMTSVYIISKDNIVDVKGLTSQRSSSKENNSNYNQAMTEKFYGDAEKAGYKISFMKLNPGFNDIMISRINQQESNSVAVDIRYNNKRGFTINTWSSDRTVIEAEELIKNLQNALELCKKLNSYNLDRIKPTNLLRKEGK